MGRLLGKSESNALGSIFGGELGSGQTKPDTLAHAIDKLEAYNDFEALQVAPLAVEAYITQDSKRAAAEVIESEYGKGDPEGLMNSHKWDYIDRMLDKAAAEVQQAIEEEKQQRADQGSSGNGGSTSSNRSSGNGASGSNGSNGSAGQNGSGSQQQTPPVQSDNMTTYVAVGAGALTLVGAAVILSN